MVRTRQSYNAKLRGMENRYKECRRCSFIEELTGR
jgi:hypothetical protein